MATLAMTLILMDEDVQGIFATNGEQSDGMDDSMGGGSMHRNSNSNQPPVQSTQQYVVMGESVGLESP